MSIAVHADANASGAPRGDLSLVTGEQISELRSITIPQLLREAVELHGTRDAAIFPQIGRRLSFEDLDQEVDALAAGFLALGLAKGDRVGIWSPNRLEWVLTQFATARIGLILVNINPAYRCGELEYALNKAGCKALVLAQAFKSLDYVSMMQTLAPELINCAAGHLISEKLPSLKHVIVMGVEEVAGCHSFDAITKLGGCKETTTLAAIDATLSPDDPINIQFTSGTTGAPKGATLSHSNIVNNARFVTDRINLIESDKLCIPVPLYHCFGMVMGVLGAVSKGAAMVFPGEGFEPLATLKVIEAENCTGVYGVPTMFVAMLQEMENQSFDLGSLRTGIMAGSPCPMDVMERVNRDMNMHEVTIAYGMTETSPVSFQSFLDDPLEKRCATVGRVHPHLEVKIIDERGAIVPLGEKGELCTRGYSVMNEYWDDDARTQDSIQDGWMQTGDLAILDKDGFCTIVGRVKDMIIRGGENIYPREIEEFLFRHPKIAQVQVFGIPNDKYGEEVCAWVISNPDETLTAEEIKVFCKGEIAHFKVPREVRIVDEIPMTITGKPQKFVMRDQMIEMMSGKSP